jgi:pimeloyl-ACP methyl ester carboxylesterase
MARFILIHGSWHGGWCWHRPQARLRALGHEVSAPDMPGHGRDHRPITGLGLTDFVEVVTRALDADDAPAVLVAHSRGGIVASAAAEARPQKVAAIVYVAAYLLPSEERVLDWALTDEESLVRANLEINQTEGWDMLRAAAFRSALYHDCSEDDVALCHALLTPEPLGPTLTPMPVTEARWGAVPRGYILLTQDRAVGPALQRRMLARTPCQRVVEIQASHSAYFSKPETLTQAILDCAGMSGG